MYQTTKLLFVLDSMSKKGEQLGMFHFGGSTHVLLFQPTVDLDFNLHGQKPGIDSSNIKVRDEIAVVK